MFCTHCGNQINEGSRFCTVCGSRLDAVPSAAQSYGLPAGINRNDKGEIVWEGECKASHYKAIYTVSRWVVGILTALAVMIVFIVYGSDGFGEIIKPLLIVLVSGLMIYLIAAGCVTILRDGRFKASFTLGGESIVLREKTQMPDSGFALFVSFIVGLFSLIGSIFMLFSDNDYHGTYSTEPYDKSLYRVTNYGKIKEVIPSADRTQIRLKKKVSSMVLLVTPEQCDYIVTEIEYRIRQTK